MSIRNRGLALLGAAGLLCAPLFAFAPQAHAATIPATYNVPVSSLEKPIVVFNDVTDQKDAVPGINFGYTYKKGSSIPKGDYTSSYNKIAGVNMKLSCFEIINGNKTTENSETNQVTFKVTADTTVTDDLSGVQCVATPKDMNNAKFPNPNFAQGTLTVEANHDKLNEAKVYAIIGDNSPNAYPANYVPSEDQIKKFAWVIPGEVNHADVTASGAATDETTSPQTDDSPSATPTSSTSPSTDDNLGRTAVLNYNGLTPGNVYTVQTTVVEPDGTSRVLSQQFTPSEASGSVTVDLLLKNPAQGLYKLTQVVSDSNGTAVVTTNSDFTVGGVTVPTNGSKSDDSASPTPVGDTPTPTPSASPTETSTPGSSSSETPSPAPSDSSTPTSTPSESGIPVPTSTPSSATPTPTETPTTAPTSSDSSPAPTSSSSSTESSSSRPSSTTPTAPSNPSSSSTGPVGTTRVPETSPGTTQTPSTSTGGATNGSSADAASTLPADTGLSYYNETLAGTGSKSQTPMIGAIASGVGGIAALSGAGILIHKNKKRNKSF